MHCILARSVKVGLSAWCGLNIVVVFMYNGRIPGRFFVFIFHCAQWLLLFSPIFHSNSFQENNKNVSEDT